MQHLEPGGDEVDFRKRRHYSRSRELQDISESGSEPEPAERHKRGASSSSAQHQQQRAMSLERPQLLGPPKPARSAERRGLLTNSSADAGGYGK